MVPTAHLYVFYLFDWFHESGYCTLRKSQPFAFTKMY